MEDGGWRMEGRGGRVEDGGVRREGGGWRGETDLAILLLSVFLTLLIGRNILLHQKMLCKVCGTSTKVNSKL